MSGFGFVRVGAASPKLRVGDPAYNIVQLEQLISQAAASGIAVLVFPELCITGYTCGDLFSQKLLLDKALDYLGKLLHNTRQTQTVSIIGMPLEIKQKLYNCAVVIQSGKVLGVVPKMFLATYKEFYEKRWFTSGYAISRTISEIVLLGQSVPFGNQIFHNKELDFSLGVEICEDLWAVTPPSSTLALQGATVIANLSASNEIVSKADYRHDLVTQQSARCMCGYVYASAGVHESTTDLVFGGDCIITENGHLLQASVRFSRENVLIYSDLDIERLTLERQFNKSFADNYDYVAESLKYGQVEISYPQAVDINETGLARVVPQHPFVPDNDVTKEMRCQEIFNIQVAGLAKRLEFTGIKRAVIGVSGGLDSTLALLVTARAFEVLGIPSEAITAITMPGFGTTNMTYQNALQLMTSMKVTIKDIDIKPACIQHFKDIGHDSSLHDTTFENVQARERTQILMDIANKENGLVVGTGDLSELALGWSTFNGDHMSMYAVNCGVPKTLVRFLVEWVAGHVADIVSREVLLKILDTPISPELLPPGIGDTIRQKTEEVVGPYELHDFFLYYVVRCGFSPHKVLFLANCAFTEKYTNTEIKKWLEVFYRRFFSQQFKRSTQPDGPKVGTISLSPRGDWRMPSDAEVTLWLEDLLKA